MTIKEWLKQEQGNHMCECGCGLYIPIKPWHHSDGIPKYIHGHHMKINPNNYKPENHTLRECECGCGELVTGAKNGKIIRFKQGHWTRLNQPMKDPIVEVKFSGKNSSKWVPIGSKRVTSSGKGMEYMTIKVAEKEWEYEHRFVIENQIGRKLTTNEHVHHINGDTLDNRPENLLLVNISDHSKLHCTFKNAPERELVNGIVQNKQV